MGFLKNEDNIIKKLSKYKDNTKRNYLISIVSVLSLEKKNKKLYDKYYIKMMDMNKNLKEIEKKGEKTETQKKNWIEFEEVENKMEEIKNNIDEFKNKKEISENQYNTLLKGLILGLYTYQPPRRNKDYNMLIVKNKKKIEYLFPNQRFGTKSK